MTKPKRPPSPDPIKALRHDYPSPWVVGEHYSGWIVQARKDGYRLWDTIALTDHLCIARVIAALGNRRKRK